MISSKFSAATAIATLIIIIAIYGVASQSCTCLIRSNNNVIFRFGPSADVIAGDGICGRIAHDNGNHNSNGGNCAFVITDNGTDIHNGGNCCSACLTFGAICTNCCSCCCGGNNVNPNNFAAPGPCSPVS